MFVRMQAAVALLALPPNLGLEACAAMANKAALHELTSARSTVFIT